MNEPHALRVGVVGATGYSGLELVRLLASHPYADLAYLAGSRARSEEWMREFPHLRNLSGLTVEPFDVDVCVARCDVVFLALPSGESGRIAAALWQRGRRVIDLSGDLRLPGDVYEAWYGKTPVEGDVWSAAVYGLTEWQRGALRTATLIANPGCYATATLLALLPAVRSGLYAPDAPIIVDAKSGVTGAGRGAAVQNLFSEMTENFRPYRVGRHQHTPEVERLLGTPGRLILTTQLLPVNRGIYASCYIPLSDGDAAARAVEVYQETYANEPFVHVLPPGEWPELKHVRGTNLCHLGLYVDRDRKVLQVFSAIDNLQKGAAGQAVQNFNVMCGVPEDAGLSVWPMVP